MDAITSTSLGPNLALAHTSEIGTNSSDLFRLFADTSKEKQKWLKDPREIHTGDQLHQLPLVNGAGASIAWDPTNYRYQWQRNGAPVARPLTHGGLIYNEQSQWWERNGSSWQPEKKSEGGRQTVIDLRILGVVVQPRASRFFGKCKTLLGLSKPIQRNAGLPKEDPRSVPTIVSEVSNPEILVARKFDLVAKSHIVYTQRQPVRLLKAFGRKSCRHPSTCTLHPHINVDFPQNIEIPLVEEPQKLKAAQSAFLLRPCQYTSHENLSHEQDPCFSDTKGEGVDVQNQEDVIRQVSDLAATGTRAEELERMWQQEEERERQEEILMSLPSPCQKENRPTSVSARTLFHNAAKSLQQHSIIPDLHGGQEQSLYARTVDALHLRGGAGRKRCSGQPRSWKIREWFIGVRREPIDVVHTESDEDDCTRRRQVRYRVVHAREAGMSDHDWAIVPVLNVDDIEDILGAATPPGERARAHHIQDPERMEGANTRNITRCRPNRTYHDERGRPQEAECVSTVSNQARRHFEQHDSGSRLPPRSTSCSRSGSHAPSDSSGSIEIIRDVNIGREQRGPPGEAYRRGQPGSHGGGFVTNAPRTHHERAQCQRPQKQPRRTQERSLQLLCH